MSKETGHGVEKPAGSGSDYQAALQAFDTTTEFDRLRGQDGSANAAEICCDRHAEEPDLIALRYRNAKGETKQWPFATLQAESSRVARILASLGVGRGDWVAGLLPRTPQLLITIIATWRLWAVYQPLFTAFGPKAIEYRLKRADAKVVVTNGEQRGKIPQYLETKILTDNPQAGDFDFGEIPTSSQAAFENEPCSLDDPFLIMFTSWTTGSPKRRVKAKLREGRCAASRVNDVWAMDFVHGQLATGPKLRILTVVDTFSRFSPAVVPRFRFRAPDVVEVLERACPHLRAPGAPRPGSREPTRPT